MPAQLVALTEGPNILLDKPILLIGRHPEADIQIASRKISRLHCCLAQVSDYLVVRDLGSTNGIRINGERKDEGRLDPGDELTIGDHQFKVQWEGAAAPKPRRQAKAPEAVSPKAAALRRAEDDLLESRDEPVPIGKPARPAEDRQDYSPPELRTARDPVPPAAPMLFPEGLQLAPSSGDFSGA